MTRVGAAEYDDLMKAIGRESVDAPSPDGFIAHPSGPRPDGGWQVVDVWDSEEAANAFYGSETFSPVTSAAAGLGIQTRPWRLHRLEIERTVKEAT
jgi:hypothetical protein